jgi:hypothetical protein
MGNVLLIAAFVQIALVLAFVAAESIRSERGSDQEKMQDAWGVLAVLWSVLLAVLVIWENI